MKSKTIRFPDKLWDKIQQIKEECGYPTDTSVIHQALITMHDDKFPAYVTTKKRAQDIRESMPLDRSTARKVEAEQRKQAEVDEKISICEELSSCTSNKAISLFYKC